MNKKDKNIKDKIWLIRTYSGHSSAKESNKLYRTNLKKGQTGLSVAFDLPTQTGYDSDHILAKGEVGKVGVPICHIGDMLELFKDIPIGKMNTSMTINATAAWLLSLYIAAAEKRGYKRKDLQGTTQNDIIKEYLDFHIIVMNFNFEKARELMIVNQLRPNKIDNPVVLELFSRIKKEYFLPENIKKNSYNDLDAHLISNRGYLKNLHVAQLIQSADISNQDKILHIGGMTGYVSTILASLCKELIIIENEEILIAEIEENMKKMNINNAKIVDVPFKEGFNNESPYDIIFIDNPISVVSNAVKSQVSTKS